MEYCCSCATKLVKRIPKGDNLPRWLCEQCGFVHYENPKIVVGTLPVIAGKVLLCRRGNEPQYGLWTLPAGYLEMGESTWQGARRETMEEVGLSLNRGELYGVLDIPHASQVHMLFLCELAAGQFDCGDESIELALFGESDLPWHELAFSAYGKLIRHYFNEQIAGTARHLFQLNQPFDPRDHNSMYSAGNPMWLERFKYGS